MALLLLWLPAMLTACGDGSPTADATTAGEVAIGDLVVSDPWIRPTAPVANVAAFYFTVTGSDDVDDRLVAVTSPRCEAVEIHQSSEQDGVTSMRLAEPEDLVVIGTGRLQLEPNGLHVMCLGTVEPVTAGETIPLTLQFEHAGSVTVGASAEQR